MAGQCPHNLIMSSCAVDQEHVAHHSMFATGISLYADIANLNGLKIKGVFGSTYQKRFSHCNDTT